jgi:hypothetical protein
MAQVRRSYPIQSYWDSRSQDEYHRQAINYLRELFPSISYPEDHVRSSVQQDFLRTVGPENFQEFSDNLHASNIDEQSLVKLKAVFFKENLGKIANKGGFFQALHFCNTPAKFAVIKLFSKYILGVDSQSYLPNASLTEICTQLMRLINALPQPEPDFLGHVRFQAKLEKLLAGRNLDYFRLFLAFIKQKEDTAENLLTIHKATDTQFTFCVERKLAPDFLAVLVANGVTAGVAQVDTDAEKAKLAACDKWAALEAVFALYTESTQDGDRFFRDNLALLFLLNKEMFDLFFKHVREIKTYDARITFLRVLSKAKTRGDNNLIISIFTALDTNNALSVIGNFDGRTQIALGITQTQTQSIGIALAATIASNDEKAKFIEIMLSEREDATDNSMPSKWYIYKRNADKTTDKRRLFSELHACNSPAKLALASMFCDHIMGYYATNGTPDDRLAGICLRLISLFNGLQEPAFFRDAKFQAKLTALITGRNLAYFTAFSEFLRENDEPLVKLTMIHKATDVQIQLCAEKRLNLDFLSMLVEHGIDRRVAPSAPEDVNRARLAAGDKLTALEAVFALFPNNTKTAIEFFHAQQTMLFSLNTEMLGLFVKHAHEITDADERIIFLRALSGSKTLENNNFIVAIFDALDMTGAMQALNVLDQKGQKALSQAQRECIVTAFKSQAANGKEKIDILEAMFHVNFPPKALQAIAKLYSLLLDRAELIKELKILKPSDNLLTAPCVEFLEVLNKKNIAIDYEFAKHLSSFPYIMLFKEIIELLSEADVQTVFNKESKKAKAPQWVSALRIIAQTSNDLVLQRKFIRLVFRIWGYAEANAQEAGMNRRDLLGDGFENSFIGFLVSVDFESSEEFRNAFLADSRAVASLIMPASALALPSSSSSRLALPAAASAGLKSLGHFNQQALTTVPTAQANTSNLAINLQRLFNRLGVSGLDEAGDWLFATLAARTSHAAFRREKDMEMTMLPDGATYLDIVDSSLALTGPQIEEIPEENENGEKKLLALTW